MIKLYLEQDQPLLYVVVGKRAELKKSPKVETEDTEEERSERESSSNAGALEEELHSALIVLLV